MISRSRSNPRWCQVLPEPLFPQKRKKTLQKPNFGLKNKTPDASTVMLFSWCLGACFRYDCSTTCKVHGLGARKLCSSLSENSCKVRGRKHARASQHRYAFSEWLVFFMSRNLHGWKHGVLPDRTCPEKCIPALFCVEIDLNSIFSF